MDEEKVVGAAGEAQPAEEAAPKKRRRRTKAEIEADAAKAVDKAKKGAKKAVKAAEKVAEDVSKAMTRATPPEIYLQFSGAEVNVLALTEAAAAKFENDESAEKPAKVKSLKLYLKPEDGAAYFVINDSYNGKVLFSEI